MPQQDFERFYYSKVALGESCGCAEQIIGTRDLDARADEAAIREPAPQEPAPRKPTTRRSVFGLAWLTAFFRK